jgi:hypothetical protein
LTGRKAPDPLEGVAGLDPHGMPCIPHQEQRMDISGKSLSADGIRAYIQAKRDAELEKERAHQAEARAEREKLHADFLERDVQPEAMDRVAALVRKAIELGEKQALLFRFPSDWLPDQGRAITNHAPDWHAHLDGFAARAYAMFVKELAPRGFQLKAEILDWPGGMPGDVGFILMWKSPEEL